MTVANAFSSNTEIKQMEGESIGSAPNGTLRVLFLTIG